MEKREEEREKKEKRKKKQKKRENDKKIAETLEIQEKLLKFVHFTLIFLKNFSTIILKKFY